jgi:ABC-type molybdate transport system substrate-binding protein
MAVIIGKRLVNSIFSQTAAAIFVLIGSQDSLNAGDLRLLSAASIQEVFKEVLGDFEQASGHKIILQYATMGAITDRIRGGEEADGLCQRQTDGCKAPRNS